MKQRYTITGPEYAHRGEMVKNAQDLILKHAAKMLSVGLRQIGHQGPPPLVYVSEGRAVFDCICGNGPSASREWGLAVCFRCGLLYTRLAFPLNWDDIDMVLSIRRRKLQNMRVGETLATLSEENREHFLPHDPLKIREARMKFAVDSQMPGNHASSMTEGEGDKPSVISNRNGGDGKSEVKGRPV